MSPIEGAYLRPSERGPKPSKAISNTVQLGDLKQRVTKTAVVQKLTHSIWEGATNLYFHLFVNASCSTLSQNDSCFLQKRGGDGKIQES